MRKVKRLMAFLLAFVMLTGTVGVYASEDTIEIYPGHYTSADKPNNVSLYGGGTTAAVQAAALTYTVPATQSGGYLLKLGFCTNQDAAVTLGLIVNGQTVGSYPIDPEGSSGGWGTDREYDIAVVNLNEGDNTIELSVSGAIIWYKTMKFIKQAAASRTGLFVGQQAFAEDSVYPRGTDTITVGYSAAVLPESLTGITLNRNTDGEPVDVECKQDGVNVKVLIKEALEYGTEYTLTLKDVVDSEENILPEESFVFTTCAQDGADSGSSSVVIDDFYVSEGVVYASGKVLGSGGSGISGRKVEFYLTMPGSSEKLISEDISGEDGAFNLEYDTENTDIMGTCRLGVKPEYATDKTYSEYECILEGSVISLNPGTYTATTNAIGTTKLGTSTYFANATLTYTVPSVISGGFLVTMKISSNMEHPFELGVEVNGNDAGTVSITPTGSASGWGADVVYDITSVWLHSGENEFKITGINESSSYPIWVKDITFTMTPAGSRESALIGDSSYEPDGVYPRGTDAAYVSYTSAIKAGSLSGITLTDDEDNVVDIKVFLDENSGNKTVVVAFKDSLDYDKNYNLNLSGVVDAAGYAMENEVLSFGTVSDSVGDRGVATAAIDSFAIKDGIAKVSGTVKGSVGEGISGRMVDFYLTLPEASAVKAASVMTGEDGKFEAEYTLPNDNIAGNCIASVDTEYALSQAEKEYFYVSESMLGPILDSLGKTKQGAGSTEDSVQYVLETNEEVLGINLSTDLAGMDASGFYGLLVGTKVSVIEQFHRAYKAALAIEKINQATERSHITDVIGNAETLDVLGIEQKMLDVLDFKRKFKLYDLLIEDERAESEEDFLTNFEEAFNECLLEQFAFESVTLQTDSAEASVGQDAEITVSASKEFAGIKKITLDVSLSGALKDSVVGFEAKSDLGEVTVTRDGNKAKIIITVSNPESASSKIATINVSGSTAGSATLSVSGTADGDTKTAYDAHVAIESKDYTITIKNQSTTSKVDGGNKGGYTGGKVSVISPTVGAGPAISTNTNTDNQFSFTDIASVTYAQEAIEALLDKGIVTMPSEKMFYPDRNLTRAEFVKMIVLSRDMYYGNAENCFGDVSEDDWYYQYVLAAINNKIIEGDGSGNFRPNDYITREDICVIIARILGEKNVSVSERFADDADIADYANAAVYQMKAAGIINGIGNNTFAPKMNTTRAMAAKIIYGLMKEGV